MANVRVDFKNEQGEQYVEMRAFKSLPWRLAKELSSVGDVEKDDGAKLRMAERLAIELVVGGEALDAYGEALVFPLNEKSVEEAPVEMLLAVLAKFSEMRSAANDPK